MIGHSFYAARDTGRRGWIGHYTCIKDGASRIARVRDDNGMIILFPSFEKAVAAAGAALCSALDDARREDRPRRSRLPVAADRIFGKAR